MRGFRSYFAESTGRGIQPLMTTELMVDYGKHFQHIAYGSAIEKKLTRSQIDIFVLRIS